MPLSCLMPSSHFHHPSHRLVALTSRAIDLCSSQVNGFPPNTPDLVVHFNNPHPSDRPSS